jgi:hypothetical protein
MVVPTNSANAAEADAGSISGTTPSMLIKLIRRTPKKVKGM